MSGPALRKADSHSLIHEAALQEARELTNIFESLLHEDDFARALETAYIAVEHWETRTLAHASAEEDRLYKEIAEESPEWKEKVVALTRDHDLMRLLVGEIKESLANERMDDGVLQRFHALILVDELHNQEEENVLPDH